MSDANRLPEKSSHSLTWIAGGMLLVAIALVVATLALQTPTTGSISTFLQWAFATNSVQTMWYITRAAGMTAYLLFWLSTAWGLAVSSKILDNMLHRSFTYDPRIPARISIPSPTRRFRASGPSSVPA